MSGFLLFPLPSSLLFLCFLLSILLLFSMPEILGFLNDCTWTHKTFSVCDCYSIGLREIIAGNLLETQKKRDIFFLYTTHILASKQIFTSQIFGTVRNLLEMRLNSRRKECHI